MTTTTAARRPGGRGEDGFLLVELLAAMSVAGILLAIGLWGFTGQQRAAEHQGSRQELVSRLRNVAERAVSEGRTYCVALDGGGRAYSVFADTCASGPAVQGPLRTRDERVTITATVTGPPACPPGATCLAFLPRGTATPAQLTVRSTARTPTYTVVVEGLTGRVE